MATWKDAVIARYKTDDPNDRYLCCSTTCIAIKNGGVTCGFWFSRATCNGVRLRKREYAYKLATGGRPKKKVKTKW